MITAFLKGLFLSLSLIVAIGPQNAFILKQGLKNHYIFATALLAAFIDATLIFAGVMGFGFIVETYPFLITAVTLAGALFLFLYGAKSFLSALKTETLTVDDNVAAPSLKRTLFILLGFTLLNPHVYLDTVFLQGSIAASFQAVQRYAFASGAMLASFIWFFGLGYGARLLAPLFTRPQSWQILDIFIGIVMWTIAAGLIIETFF